jgi:hypothetical protein
MGGMVLQVAGEQEEGAASRPGSSSSATTALVLDLPVTASSSSGGGGNKDAGKLVKPSRPQLRIKGGSSTLASCGGSSATGPSLDAADCPPSARGLPPSILPFLRELSAADMNGGASTPLDPAESQQREVWTCGQNSYGELAHGDTVSRKVHTITEVCQGREIVGVAAGEREGLAWRFCGGWSQGTYLFVGWCMQAMSTRSC